MNKSLDLFERSARGLARNTSRRGFLSKLGAILLGTTSTLPLLPVARGMEPASGSPIDDASINGKKGDPTACEYWRNCGISGFLCGCCGGTATTCPPGTVVGSMSWIGTCRNPVDGKDYIISYHDCCGKAACGRCYCDRNEGDMPPYFGPRDNEINWCMGVPGGYNVYNCTRTLVVGVSGE